MRLMFLGFILICSTSVRATDKVSFKNEREGKSYYNSRSINKAQERALRGVTSAEIVNAFNSALEAMPENKLCSFNLNNQMKYRLMAVNFDFKEVAGALYHLRAKGEIDDVSLKILLKAHEVQTKYLVLPKNAGDLWLPRGEKKVSDMLAAIEAANNKLKKGCLDEVYSGLYFDLQKIDKKIKDYHVEALLVEAYEKNIINVPTYKLFEQARTSDLQKTPLTLKSYYKKIQSLRTHFPLRDVFERSDFTSQKFHKQKVSRRQHLLENYSDLQIMLMGDVIKKLRARLDSDKVEILVYARDQVDEVITLEPMERFRFAIKVLRKEMGHLALNTYFNGVAPDYIDLMTAAYETGIIPGVELDEIAGLKEIWNPKKTFWDKARLWVQTFASVAGGIIPPPYGFLPALGLVVIEATVGKKQTTTNETSLF